MDIIGFSGWAGAGKDTAALALLSRGYRKLSFADPLRELAALCDPVVGWETGPITYMAAVEAIGYDEAKFKYPELRQFLQRLGNGARTTFGDDFWINKALGSIAPDESVVMTDVRYKNEAAAIKRVGGLVVRIERPGVEAANDHISEHDLDDWDFDAVFVNEGAYADLWAQVEQLVASRATLA